MCIVLTLGGGLLGACYPPDKGEPLEISSEKTVFSANDETIMLTLSNRSGAPVHYGEAFALDRGEEEGNGNAWAEISFEAKGDYISDPLWERLESGEEVVYPVSFAELRRYHHFEQGTYRVCIPYYINEDVKTRKMVAFVFEFEKPLY